MNVIEDMKQHIQSINNPLEMEYLDKLPVISLLRLCHPIYRKDYASKAVQEWKIKKAVAEQLFGIK